MGKKTSANARRAPRFPPIPTHAGITSHERLVAAEKLVGPHALEGRPDVQCLRRTAPSQGRPLLPTRRSWSAGRALNWRRTAGEPPPDLERETLRAYGDLLERAASRPGRAAAPYGSEVVQPIHRRPRS